MLTWLGVPYERRELSVFDRSNRGDVLDDLSPALPASRAAQD
jgi:hypothetical protein